MTISEMRKLILEKWDIETTEEECRSFIERKGDDFFIRDECFLNDGSMRIMRCPVCGTLITDWDVCPKCKFEYECMIGADGEEHDIEWFREYYRIHGSC